MAVYVDALMNHGWKNRGRYVLSCHMWADDCLELEDMAVRIGLKAEWRQRTQGLVHYGLTPCKRNQALKRGAIALTLAQTVQHWASLGILSAQAVVERLKVERKAK